MDGIFLRLLRIFFPRIIGYMVGMIFILFLVVTFAWQYLGYETIFGYPSQWMMLSLTLIFICSAIFFNIVPDDVLYKRELKIKRAPLVALYDATNGENWKNNRNWKTNKHLNEWYGVTTNDSGQVIRLELSYNRLSGQIPPELDRLDGLEKLELDGNPDLYVPFDTEFRAWLANLKEFSIDNLDPSDVAFREWLAILKEFSIDDDDWNKDRAALIALYDATNGGNWQSNTNWKTDKPLSEWFGVKTNESGQVTELRLSYNKLSGSIPTALGQLTNLRGLWLSDNGLSGQIPVELGQLTNLQVLSLRDNGLSGQIPVELGQLHNLQELSLSNNELSGQIPTALGQLENLTELRLEGNPGLYAPSDAEFREWLANLEEFSIDNLDPIDDSDRAALIALYDATNGGNWQSNTNWKTDKPLSEWYGVSTNESGQVIRLWLFSNGLSGQIPVELGQLTNLETLALGSNELSGQIPVELGQLTNLKTLALGSNELSGQIPVELGQLTNLKTLALGSNELSGQIPVELGQLTNLNNLSLRDNQLSGQIPVELGQLRHLKKLRLEGNSGLYAPSDADFQAWLENLKRFSIDGPDLKEIERLLDGVKPPDDQVLAFLKLYMGLTQTLKEKIGAIGNGATALQGFAIQKALEDLTEIEETIAQVAKQTEGVVQQRSELEGQNAQLGSELEAQNAVLKDKRTGLEAKNSAFKDEKATFERRRRELEEVTRSLAERKTEIPRIEAQIQEIDAKSAAFCVDDTVEKFYEAVEKLRQKEQDGRDIVGQIGGVLRLHRDDNVEVLEALKQCGELEEVNLKTAIDLSDRVAKNLSDLDHRLGTLVEERD